MGKTIWVILGVLLLGSPALSQSDGTPDSLMPRADVNDCVRYALSHQPIVRQSLLDEEITNKLIGIRLADWFPQVRFNFTLQHYFQLPTSIVQGNPTSLGVANTSTGQFAVTQAIFDRDLLLAGTTAADLRDESMYRTASTKIAIALGVSKAFYAAFLTKEQTEILDDDIIRLQQSVTDAFHQYQSGVVDKTDYMRATIALNNAAAQRRQSAELMNVRIAFLKELMGYPPEASLTLESDSAGMEKEILIDTAQTLHYENRVEYQLLQIGMRLQEANLSYSQWGFLPSLSAFGSYNLNYLNSKLPPLFRHNYPSSLVGVELSFPIFEGGKRILAIQQASLEVKRFAYNVEQFKDSVNTEYTQALANYKSSLNTYYTLKKNLELATEVYRVIQLQYKAGIKSYLEVLTAETDLRTAQLNRTDALFQVLSSKLDVQRALGMVRYR